MSLQAPTKNHVPDLMHQASMPAPHSCGWIHNFENAVSQHFQMDLPSIGGLVKHPRMVHVNIVSVLLLTTIGNRDLQLARCTEQGDDKCTPNLNVLRP
jgi:hypothetical protein